MPIKKSKIVTHSNSQCDVILCFSFTVFDSNLIQTLIFLLGSLDDDNGAVCMNILLLHKAYSWRLTHHLWRKGSEVLLYCICSAINKIKCCSMQDIICTFKFVLLTCPSFLHTISGSGIATNRTSNSNCVPSSTVFTVGLLAKVGGMPSMMSHTDDSLLRLRREATMESEP